MYRTLVFTRTKHGADRVVRHLAHARHSCRGDSRQQEPEGRQRALANFAADQVPVLVATDIASRGIDVDGITHVVNYDLTHEPETYVHRIGRTGRAGASGSAVSFCDREEVSNLRAIERLIRRPIPSAVNPLPSTAKEIAPRPPAHRHEEHHRPHRAAAHGAIDRANVPRAARPAHANSNPAHHPHKPGAGARRSLHPSWCRHDRPHRHP